jgi:hypothetical protein
MIARVVAMLLLPFVHLWAKRHERGILRHGSRLSMQQLEDAARVGVQEADRVRVVVVQTVPPRLPRFLRKLAARCGLGPATTAGMALGHGIYVRADQYGRRELLVHELVHTAQYERLGFGRFLRQYLRECFADGYPAGKLEAEATRLASGSLSAADQDSIT